MSRPKKSSQGAANASATSAPAGTPPAVAAAVPATDVETPAARDAAGPARAPDPALDGLFDDPRGEVAQLGAGEGITGLEGLDALALYALRQEIDSLLPPADLQRLDLVEETVRQYQAAKALLASVLSNAGVAANQKAQVINSVAAVLETLAKTQTALYNAEMVKAMETAIDAAFAAERLPVKQAFYTRYEALLREAAARRQEKREKER